ncbi:UNVERIFIED_CONTAM: hypothetical protein RMT77_008743 [Armadillidium vulgare]
MKFVLVVLIAVLQFELRYQFVVDKECLHNSSGVSTFLYKEIFVSFYLPYKWLDIENNLLIRFDDYNIVLKHPRSKYNSEEINFKLYKFKIGWNEIVVKRSDKNVTVLRKTYGGKDQWIPLLNLTVTSAQESNNGVPILVKGMNSFVNCTKSKRFFVIPAGKSVEIPEAMYGNDDSFVAYFESHAFSFEIILSGKRRNVCEEEVPDQPNKYFVRIICKSKVLKSFSQSIDYEVHMFPDDFEKEDILFFEDLAFMQYTLHNIGDADFYIQTLFFTPSLAPITFLVTGDHEAVHINQNNVLISRGLDNETQNADKNNNTGDHEAVHINQNNVLISRGLDNETQNEDKKNNTGDHQPVHINQNNVLILKGLENETQNVDKNNNTGHPLLWIIITSVLSTTLIIIFIAITIYVYLKARFQTTVQANIRTTGEDFSSFTGNK